MRIMWRALGLTALVAAGLIFTNGTLSAGDAPVVHVKAVVHDGVVRLEAQANGPFEYTSYRASESLYVLDLSGVSAADPAGDRTVASDLIKGYRETTYSAGEKPVVRLEVLLGRGIEPRFERTDSQDLAVLVSGPNATAAPATLKPVSAKSSDAPVSRSDFQAIREVTLSQAGDKTEVNVSGSGPLNYRASRLQNPDRLVLDFQASHLKTSVKHIASNLEPVREIRLAQFTPEVSRVVIDLRQPARYNISANGNDVTVAFAPGAGAVKAAPVDAPANLVTTKAEVAPSAPVVKTASAQAPIPAPAAVLPAALTQPSSALADPVPAKLQQQEGAAATQLASQAASASSSAGSAPAQDAPAPAAPVAQPAVNPVPQQPDAQAAAPAASRYSGEPISVNLKDVDLRDFFRLIHEISGLNVVVDPAVKGTLTIVLDDVPWDQALDIVLHNNDLDKQLDGNVLRIATKETVKKEAEETRDLAKAQAEAAEVVTTTRVLSYAKAADMATTLKKFLSSRGDILADDRSNTLIIRDVPSVLPVIDNLLRQLDRKAPQVEIEARVVAANRSFDREIGTILGFSGASGHSAFGGTGTVGQTETSFNPPPPYRTGSGSSTSGGTAPLLTNLGASSATSGLAYLFASPNFALDYVINALEEKGVGKLLSKPKIITQNNQKATVKQGTKIPVQTIVNNTVSVQFVDAVLELDVTPQITKDGTIYMDVTVENDQIDQSIPRVQGIPAIDTQSAQTRVTVNDGATVVVGGIIVSTQRTDVQQVPVLGSVPIIGNLFKKTIVNSTAQELLFFLTPRILPG
ncbi:MAG TPA: type IV pilus secretin PilQ [Candidatus Limnocylindrales bacterium]|nr:type IV pilus secretin PilQ [Candidatus Limnocylindrales bacterium]